MWPISTYFLRTLHVKCLQRVSSMKWLLAIIPLYISVTFYNAVSWIGVLFYVINGSNELFPRSIRQSSLCWTWRCRDAVIGLCIALFLPSAASCDCWGLSHFSLFGRAGCGEDGGPASLAFEVLGEDFLRGFPMSWLGFSETEDIAKSDLQILFRFPCPIVFVFIAFPLN